MDVQFVREGDGEAMYVAEITVDSGAEESVCPVDWGREFGTKAAAEKMRLVNAGGGTIRHVGSRRVTFKSVGFKRRDQNRTRDPYDRRVKMRMRCVECVERKMKMKSGAGVMKRRWTRA